MALAVVVAMLGWIVAMIAWKKGRAPVAWFVYGAILFPIALTHALLLDPLPEEERAAPPSKLAVAVVALLIFGLLFAGSMTRMH